MAFWVGWELWVKLSVVLALLITLVFLYAICVLVWNRWRMRQYAATEAKERDEEAELYPMLHTDDIPFGARALERGIEVEGIWLSNPNTPTQSPYQPATPAESRPASPAPRSLSGTFGNVRSSVGSQNSPISPKLMPPAARRDALSEVDLASAGFVYENDRTGAPYNRASLPINPNALRMSPSRVKQVVGTTDTKNRQRRASFHTQVLGTSSQPHMKNSRTSSNGVVDDRDYVPNMNGSPCTSADNKGTSRLAKVLRRRSSEEYRRKMSQIFNDNIQMRLPADQLEFDPTLREYQRRNLRSSLLRPFRSRRQSSGNG